MTLLWPEGIYVRQFYEARKPKAASVAQELGAEAGNRAVPGVAPMPVGLEAISKASACDKAQ